MSAAQRMQDALCLNNQAISHQALIETTVNPGEDRARHCEDMIGIWFAERGLWLSTGVGGCLNHRREVR
jgi:hypothetical protein